MMGILHGKNWGRKKLHPLFQIQNENGVHSLDWDFLFTMCCIIDALPTP